jgi:protein CpxP
MNTKRRLSAASALVAATLAFPAIGWAQTQPAPAAPSPAQTEPAMTAPVMPQHAAAPAGHPVQLSSTEKSVEQHIKELHNQLHITAAQQPQWEQFAQVMRDNASAMTSSLDQRAQQIGTMNAVDSMLSFAHLAEQRSQDLGKLATAFQTLYATFSDQQKQSADMLFRRQAETHADRHMEKHSG